MVVTKAMVSKLNLFTFHKTVTLDTVEMEFKCLQIKHVDVYYILFSSNHFNTTKF